MNNKVFASLAVVLLCRDFMLTAGNTWSNTHRQSNSDGFIATSTDQQRRDRQAEREWALLCAAAANGDIDELKAVIKRGVSVNIRNMLGASPLDVAIYHHRPKAVSFLLEQHASVIEEDSSGRTSISKAVEKIEEDARTPEILHLLLRHHPSIHTLKDNVRVPSSWEPSLTIILDDAIEEVEGHTKSSTVTASVLTTHKLLHAPIIGIVQSFISRRQETPEERAQTLLELSQKALRLSVQNSSTSLS